MNVYHVGWVQSDQFGLSAVVIANSEDEAINALDLDDSYNSDIKISLVGTCTDGTDTVQIICQECI